MSMQPHEKTIPFPSSRTLCHFCGAWRKIVINFNLPKGMVDRLPSKRAKLRLCSYCIETLDSIASDTEKHPGRRLAS